MINMIDEEQIMTDVGQIFESMLKELNTIKEPRGLTLTLHLYIEYWLDLLIKKYFKHSDLILEDNPANDLRTFYNKLVLLNSIGIVEGNLFSNLKIINNIRNDFAHNLNLNDPKARKKFEDKVCSMKVEDPTAIKMSLPTETKFTITSMEIIVNLNELYAKQ